MDLYTVLGIFAERPFAEQALTQLEEAGYNPKDMSIIMRDHETAKHISGTSGANVAGGALSGAATGAVVGGLAGLLVGVGAIAIPGLGAFLVGGPIAVALGLTGAAATTISGAATGAVAGGILGALMGLGLPEQDARVYEQHINEGGILLAVPAIEEEIAQVKDILHQNHATQIRSFVMEPAVVTQHQAAPMREDVEAVEADEGALTAAEVVDEEPYDYENDEIPDREYIPGPSINSASRPAYAYVGAKGGSSGSTRSRLRHDLFGTNAKDTGTSQQATQTQPFQDRPVRRIRRDIRY